MWGQLAAEKEAGRPNGLTDFLGCRVIIAECRIII